MLIFSIFGVTFVSSLKQIHSNRKKIEIQITDSKVKVGADQFDGYSLAIGKKVIGEIAELDGQFAIIKNGNAESFYKKLERAVETLIETYNLSK